MSIARDRTLISPRPNDLVLGDDGETYWAVWTELRANVRQPGRPQARTNLEVGDPHLGVAYAASALHVLHIDEGGQLVVARWDASPTFTPVRTVLDAESTGLTSPALANLGERLGAVWLQGSALKAQVLDALNQPVSTPLTLSTGGASAPVVHADADAFVITWLAGGGLRMARVSIDGALLSSSDAPLPVNAVRYDTAPTGDGFAVAWVDAADHLWLTEFDRQGQALGDPLRVSEALSFGETPSLSWTGAELVLAWVEYATRPTRGGAYARVMRLQPGSAALAPAAQLQLYHSDTYRPSVVAIDDDTVEVLATTSELLERRRFELSCR